MWRLRRVINMIAFLTKYTSHDPTSAAAAAAVIPIHVFHKSTLMQPECVSPKEKLQDFCSERRTEEVGKTLIVAWICSNSRINIEGGEEKHNGWLSVRQAEWWSISKLHLDDHLSIFCSGVQRTRHFPVMMIGRPRSVFFNVSSIWRNMNWTLLGILVELNATYREVIPHWDSGPEYLRLFVNCKPAWIRFRLFGKLWRYLG